MKFSCLTLQTTSLALSYLLWLLRSHEPFYISNAERLKFMCEFCISKYCDSYSRGNQLFQKYGLLTDLKRHNAIYVFKLNECIYWQVWRIKHCNKTEVWIYILILCISCEKIGMYNWKLMFQKSRTWSIFWYSWVNMLAVLKKSLSEKGILPIHVGKARSG